MNASSRQDLFRLGLENSAPLVALAILSQLLSGCAVSTSIDGQTTTRKYSAGEVTGGIARAPVGAATGIATQSAGGVMEVASVLLVPVGAVAMVGIGAVGYPLELLFTGSGKRTTAAIDSVSKIGSRTVASGMVAGRDVQAVGQYLAQDPFALDAAKRRKAYASREKELDANIRETHSRIAVALKINESLEAMARQAGQFNQRLQSDQATPQEWERWRQTLQGWKKDGQTAGVQFGQALALTEQYLARAKGDAIRLAKLNKEAARLREENARTRASIEQMESFSARIDLSTTTPPTASTTAPDHPDQ